MNERAYLESGGTICFGCGSKNIDAGQFDFGSADVTQDRNCKDCGFKWRDIYKLVGMEER